MRMPAGLRSRTGEPHEFGEKRSQTSSVLTVLPPIRAEAIYTWGNALTSAGQRRYASAADGGLIARAELPLIGSCGGSARASLVTQSESPGRSGLEDRAPGRGVEARPRRTSPRGRVAGTLHSSVSTVARSLRRWLRLLAAIPLWPPTRSSSRTAETGRVLTGPSTRDARPVVRRLDPEALAVTGLRAETVSGTPPTTEAQHLRSDSTATGHIALLVACAPIWCTYATV
jgi:hypothetical protein